MTSPSSLSSKDREKALAMCLVAERDMRDELSTMKTFRSTDALLPYVTSTLEHIRSVIEIRVPMVDGTSFILAPKWSLDQMPIDDDWERAMYKELQLLSPSVQWHLALTYGCLSCLDLLFGYTLLYLVLT